MTASVVTLVGLPGSGKSTVAPLLARRLGWRCADIDSMIEAKHGIPAGEVLALQGETLFRVIERDLLHEALAGSRPAVIACGGGLMSDEAAGSLLLRTSLVVWLDAPDAVLLRRIGDGAGRPLLQPEPQSRLAALRAGRSAAHAAAHLRVDTGGDVAATVDCIMSLLNTVRIDTPSGAHHSHIGAGLLQTLAAHVPGDANTVALVHDAALVDAAATARTALQRGGFRVETIAVEGGETAKSWSAAGILLERLASAALHRNDCVVALGGGTVGDLAGFVAATYLRGVRWVNVPSTLLAMADSAVGGKTGVNLSRGKNLAGAFWQPRAVVCDITLLSTVSDRAYRSAISEIVKYAMLDERAFRTPLDQDLDALLRREPYCVERVLHDCCTLKARVVSGDDRDSDARAVLNYGHTAGHAVEAAAPPGTMLHGEAVAVGLRVAGLLSCRISGCPDTDIAWQDGLLERAGLPSPPRLDLDLVRERMTMDKKNVGGENRWVLLERRGRPVTGVRVAESAAVDALQAVLAA